LHIIQWQKNHSIWLRNEGNIEKCFNDKQVCLMMGSSTLRSEQQYASVFKYRRSTKILVVKCLCVWKARLCLLPRVIHVSTHQHHILCWIISIMQFYECVHVYRTLSCCRYMLFAGKAWVCFQVWGVYGNLISINVLAQHYES
jgi:hypothetical protein